MPPRQTKWRANRVAEPDCRTIESRGGRLACYDTAFPPQVKKPATTGDDASRAAYKDPLIAEDARIAAKLKNICRGCAAVEACDEAPKSAPLLMRRCR